MKKLTQKEQLRRSKIRASLQFHYMNPDNRAKRRMEMQMYWLTRNGELKFT